MAKTKYQPARPELTAGELCIGILPRHHDRWFGTAAQLIEAGLLPEGFQWPDRTSCKYFTHGGIECSVQRRRPRGSGCSGAWVTLDYWELSRWCKDRGTGADVLYRAEQLLQYKRWIKRTAGEISMLDRLITAQDDSRFQAFKQRAMGFGREASHD